MRLKLKFCKVSIRRQPNEFDQQWMFWKRVGSNANIEGLSFRRHVGIAGPIWLTMESPLLATWHFGHFFSLCVFAEVTSNIGISIFLVKSYQPIVLSLFYQ